ncbi:Rpn family recombination-promoting nuclease/putative transposase [Lachnospiraceae bacterium ZAX-1]
MGEKDIDIDIDIDKLGLDNDFLFSAVMGDEYICKTFLESLLKIKIEKIMRLDAQKTLNSGIDIKGIRLDIYVKDGKGTVYNVEMQVSKERNIPKRMRYYGSAMDEDLLRKGMFYQDLPNSYIIFICTWDYIGLGQGIYLFENTLRGNPKCKLDDGMTRIILNTEGSLDGLERNVVDLLTYIKSGAVSGDWVRMIDEKVRLLKSDKKWRANFMMWIMHEEELKREGIREGIREGKKEGIEKGVQALIEVLSEDGYKMDAIQDRIIQKFNMSEDIAKGYIEKYLSLQV